MSTRLSRAVLLGLGVLATAVALTWAGAARAVTIAPPWCGTPEPDAAGALPDGTNPSDPPGSFPHIPYYAIGCTLDAIKAENLDGRMSVRVFGHSAAGRCTSSRSTSSPRNSSGTTSRAGRSSATTR